MAEVKTAVLIAVVAIVWTPFLIFIGSDLLRWFRDRRDCRRLARRLRADAAAYRDVVPLRVEGPAPVTLEPGRWITTPEEAEAVGLTVEAERMRRGELWPTPDRPRLGIDPTDRRTR